MFFYIITVCLLFTTGESESDEDDNAPKNDGRYSFVLYQTTPGITTKPMLYIFQLVSSFIAFSFCQTLMSSVVPTHAAARSSSLLVWRGIHSH